MISLHPSVERMLSSMPTRSSEELISLANELLHPNSKGIRIPLKWPEAMKCDTCQLDEHYISNAELSDDSSGMLFPTALAKIVDDYLGKNNPCIAGRGCYTNLDKRNWRIYQRDLGSPNSIRAIFKNFNNYKLPYPSFRELEILMKESPLPAPSSQIFIEERAPLKAKLEIPTPELSLVGYLHR